LYTIEVRHQQAQAEYFRTRSPTGPIVRPLVFQPTIEPGAGALVVIFVERGAVHLVFNDEVHPIAGINEAYRTLRARQYGRTRDVESLEVLEGDLAYFPGSGAGRSNVYETNIHVYTSEPFTGSVFSQTWNHLLSSHGSPMIELRGGYRVASAPIMYGGRAEAEQYS
ncbi:MAG: hypothetical protein Q8O76_03690, partial [Chloroflexota bacterium]|nr:hypothetical protein [Chloroflexota bacterium]